MVSEPLRSGPESTTTQAKGRPFHAGDDKNGNEGAAAAEKPGEACSAVSERHDIQPAPVAVIAQRDCRGPMSYDGRR